MDNQHQKIKGYRDLSQTEIDLMNEIKAEGERLAALCAKVAMAATDLQVGVMKLVRAVARPSSF